MRTVTSVTVTVVANGMIVMFVTAAMTVTMEERIKKNLNNCFNTNIYSYLETFGGQIYNPYLIVVHFFNISLN
jgi:hypothetical protein